MQDDDDFAPPRENPRRIGSLVIAALLTLIYFTQTGEKAIGTLTPTGATATTGASTGATATTGATTGASTGATGATTGSGWSITYSLSGTKVEEYTALDPVTQLPYTKTDTENLPSVETSSAPDVSADPPADLPNLVHSGMISGTVTVHVRWSGDPSLKPDHVFVQINSRSDSVWEARTGSGTASAINGLDSRDKVWIAMTPINRRRLCWQS